MKSYLVILILCLKTFYSFSQENPPDSLTRKEKRKWDKAHNIVDLSDQLSIKFSSTSKSNKITHHDGFTQREIEYMPNEISNLGIGVSYKWLGLDIVFNSPSKDDETFGKTKRFDIESSFYMHKFVVDASYKWYRGYYGSNPDSYDPGFTTYPIRPDVKTRALNLSALYVFNHQKFSFRHAFTFNEIQKRSMGSFMAGGYLSTFQMDADSTLIPFQVKEVFDSTADFRGVKYVGMGVSGGYAYNLILLKHIYASASVVLGLGPLFENTPTLEDRPAESNVYAVPFGSVRVAIGYNGHKWFGGLTALTIGTGARDKTDSFVKREFNRVQLHVGFRIAPPKPLKKLFGD